MHIAVLGAGIAGITTAWQLLKDGHEVTVIDRESEAANFTSFGNAGLIAPGHAYAWASPRAPGMMWRSLWRGDQAIRLKPQLSPRQWAWIAGFLAQCTAGRATANTKVKARLCTYSQQVLHEVVAETGIPYDRVEGGLVYFYRTPATFKAAVAKCQILRDCGIAIEELDTAAAIAKDPGLAAARDQIAGALFVPGDEGGDCRIFAQGLAEACRKKGATLMLGTTVKSLSTAGGEVRGIETDKGTVKADAYVLCLGVYSPHLAGKLGIRLAIYPVKGYSMTIPITDKSAVAQRGGVDEDNLLAYCPFGARMRVTATAEIAGYSTAHRPEDFRVMTERTKKLFPKGLDFAKASHWAGLRPMTPTAIPIIDRSPIPNLFLNTGHGHMGWTMSNGSARILADLIGQKQPAIEHAGMGYGG